ncbi:hypothetical protein ANCCEY_03693 [Ancylostoma ceylanicum]|uniref:Saposin B-type domain-containing protein n=2 Tax=Ancylostoma ceylanicum TaxID=53326 RepID=A0A0D6M188_9BILA|nr:hypothetical protein ANCCEY_03693 [Ancylostoma ceylanicum]EYC45070.1 hypothetical protein Y032_0439g1485 [Ancylostoma ceylanicum]
MKAVFHLVAIFCLSYLVNADRDCRLECFNAALSYRNAKKENLGEKEIEERVREECETFAKKLYYPCSKAVPLILENDDIKKTIEAWDVDSASDKVTEEAVKKYCWKACRNRREE